VTETRNVGLPARFVGAWLRRELIVDGEIVDNAYTVWVEAGRAFVDVRAPGSFASDTTFAGTTTWVEPYLTWTHEIDAAPDGGGVDRGHITFAGETMIESGEYMADRLVTYQELWSPRPGAAGVVAVARTEGGIAVRVGGYAAVVLDERAQGGAIAARGDVLVDGSWHTEVQYGEEAARASLPAPLDPTGPPPSGWSWC
jgi:hypothetical protein